MPRKGNITRRRVVPDPIYNDQMVTRLINALMVDGKKNVSERIVYKAFDFIKEKGSDPLDIFKKAISHVKPVLEVRSRRVGGATYQVPIEVRPERSVALTMRWLVTYSRRRSGKTMFEKLAMEILDASVNRGSSVKKKDEVHKMADANKAFAHYRW